MTSIGASHELPTGHPCPSCGELLDAAAPVDGEARPKPGDVTLCLYCGHLRAFAETGFRDLTDSEAHAIAGDRRILDVQEARRLMGAAPRRREP